MHLCSAAANGKSHWRVLTDPRTILGYGGAFKFKQQKRPKRAKSNKRASNSADTPISPAEWLGPDPDSPIVYVV